MAYRTDLLPQFLWASQQAIEKYLKCILLLHRVPARGIMHHLKAALIAVVSSGKIFPALDLTEETSDFIDRLDRYGWSRYLEVPNFGLREDIVNLDRAVWELRRYCTLIPEPRQVLLRDGAPPPRVWIEGGCLESMISNKKSPARGQLLWQNAFFGVRAKRTIRIAGPLLRATNSPLSLNPHVLDEVLKYVHLPRGVIEEYRVYIENGRPTSR